MSIKTKERKKHMDFEIKENENELILIKELLHSYK